jgi:hypothetical protein
VKRYFDAYRVAKVIDSLGGLIKTLGIGCAVLVALAGFFLLIYSRGAETIIAAGILVIILGIAIGALFYVAGVLVSASGQILKASLDAAVNTSPFLEIEEKAKVMSV